MSRRQPLIRRYGCMAVGQRVRFSRNCVLPPCTDPKEFMEAFYRWEVELVSLESEGAVTSIRRGECSAFVTMRMDDGREVCRTLDAWGMEPGGYDRLHVLREPPSQRELLRGAA